VKVREGTNGFICIVERETPLTMDPECYDAEIELGMSAEK
jgi:hypothetical protein